MDTGRIATNHNRRRADSALRIHHLSFIVYTSLVLSLLTPPSSDWSQLPFLLRLLDDPSPAVREKIALRIGELGDELWNHLDQNQIQVSASQRHALREILARGHKKSTPALAWPHWIHLPGENEKLEAAFAWLSQKHGDPQSGEDLRAHLDALARQYLMGGGIADPEELSVYLFDDCGLQGASADNFHDPNHSDLLHVLQHREGLPISLCAIFILMGWRLDITIYGCNFPGHFLARAPITSHHYHDEDLVFDPFHRGRILNASEMSALRLAAPDALSTPATATEIIARVLRNQASAYFHHHDAARARETLELLTALEKSSS